MPKGTAHKILSLIAAALLAGAALLTPDTSGAGSCCGGAAVTNLIVPKFARAVADLSFDMELYDGFWNQDGVHTPDPPGSDLRQYRLNLAYAHRLARDWQAGIILPYVWNRNTYSGLSSGTDGLGDATAWFLYEALDDKTAWKIRTVEDLIPAVYVGLSLLVPTGISPYDDVSSSFDVTGRGLYRVDGNLLIDKTIQPWNVSLFLSYGTYIERSVNQEYSKFVEPYDKQLGNRTAASLSLSYNYFLGTGGDALSGTASYFYLHEANGSINGVSDSSTAFRKQAAGFSLAYYSTDHDWSVRAGWNHAIQKDGWGKNFPTTDIFTVGVRYVFR